MRIYMWLTEVMKSTKRLRAFLHEKGFDIGQAEALDLSARLIGFDDWASYRDRDVQPMSLVDQDLGEPELAQRNRFQMDVLEREGYGEIANEFLDRVDPTGLRVDVPFEYEGFHLLRRQPRLRIVK
jgi:hypothetical protein